MGLNLLHINQKILQWHTLAKQNIWLHYFSICVRLALAAGFIPSGIIKIIGERFTSLPNNHPMGNYLEALHHTGYYYTFIGWMQVLAALLLLIPFTVLLGALLYFPIILNICILSLAVCFEGSLLSSPLMVVANIYLLCWHYDRVQYFFSKLIIKTPVAKPTNKRFPFLFFMGSFVAVALLCLLIVQLYTIHPRNTFKDCSTQCTDSINKQACIEFCNCIHRQGKNHDSCVNAYKKAIRK